MRYGIGDRLTASTVAWFAWLTWLESCKETFLHPLGVRSNKEGILADHVGSCQATCAKTGSDPIARISTYLSFQPRRTGGASRQGLEAAARLLAKTLNHFIGEFSEFPIVAATLTQPIFLDDDDWIGGFCVKAAQRSTAFKLLTLPVGGPLMRDDCNYLIEGCTIKLLSFPNLVMPIANATSTPGR